MPKPLKIKFQRNRKVGKDGKGSYPGRWVWWLEAERLAAQVSDEHQITLVSRSRNFVFYPALVRLAFGKCEPEDVSFELRHAMLNRRVNFIEAEVARVDLLERNVTIAHGEVEGKLGYDYLVFALGRGLATERIPGFYEHAHHLLNVDKAIKFW